MTAPDPIIRRKLSDEVLDRLVHLIESGEIPADAQMPSERELMARFGVGRPAIREAMQALDRMGLIAISHGERARVTRPTAEDMFSRIDRVARHLLLTSPDSLGYLKEAREFFEAGMASEAARKATAQDIARLRDAWQTQVDATGADPAAFVHADMEFHARIASVSRNPVFEAVGRAMLQWLSQYHPGILRWHGHEQVTLEEHRRVLECIAAHDADGAAHAMRSHLRRSSPIYQPNGPTGSETSFS